jgi:pimeloyl-ACP methyl ester carboxylesterase
MHLNENSLSFGNLRLKLIMKNTKLKAFFLIFALILSPSLAFSAVSKFKDPVFGVEVHIEQLGLENPESVLLVHGLGDNAARDWSNIAPELAKKYHVIMIDLPGFGNTGHAKETLYTLKNYSQLLSVVSKKYSKMDKVILIGHSLGGAISLSFAHKNPEQIKQLILIDAAGILHRSIYVAHLATYKPKKLSGFPFAGLLNKALNSVNGLTVKAIELTDNFTSAQDLLMSNAKLRARLAKDNLTVRAAANLIATDFGEAIASIETPTLILWGDQDRIAPLRTGKLLNHHLKNSALKVFTGVGHVPMTDVPKKVNSEILAWLATPYFHHTTPPEITDSSYECSEKSYDEPKIISGGFKTIKVTKCSNLIFKDVSTTSIESVGSRFELENVYVKTQDTGLRVTGSEIKATNLTIESGADAIFMDGSKMDIVGAKITAAKKIVSPQAKSLIYWSLGNLSSPGLGNLKIHKRLTYKKN